MKIIKLTQKKICFVDDEDYIKFKGVKWYANKIIGKFYVVKNGKLLHREIMCCPKGMVVDHIDGNTLDNRKENLRICTHRQNIVNSKKQSTNKSGYKGVSFYKSTGKWRAQIHINGKNISLGHFLNPLDAYNAYCKANIKYNFEYANNN